MFVSKFYNTTGTRFSKCHIKCSAAGTCSSNPNRRHSANTHDEELVVSIRGAGNICASLQDDHYQVFLVMATKILKLGRINACVPCRCLHHGLLLCMSASALDNFHSTRIRITEIDYNGGVVSKVVRKSDLLAQQNIQPRDLRFSTASSLYVRGTNIIIRLQYIKAIIRYNSITLLDSDHPSVHPFVLELQDKLRGVEDLPFEFIAIEAMLLKMFSDLDAELAKLEPALKNILNSLLDPHLFSVDRGELHILLHHSKSLSEFHSVVRDVECTLAEVLDADESMADMYLTHLATVGRKRDPQQVDDVCNMLEAYACQVENILSKIQTLREVIDSSESVILINLDSQRNVMLRLSLQLEMGTFSAAIGGLIGMAFGMNLNSSLEDNTYAFWVCTGMMVTLCGLLWRRLLLFLGNPLKTRTKL